MQQKVQERSTLSSTTLEPSQLSVVGSIDPMVGGEKSLVEGLRGMGQEMEMGVAFRNGEGVGVNGGGDEIWRQLRRALLPNLQPSDGISSFGNSFDIEPQYSSLFPIVNNALNSRDMKNLHTNNHFSSQNNIFPYYAPNHERLVDIFANLYSSNTFKPPLESVNHDLSINVSAPPACHSSISSLARSSYINFLNDKQFHVDENRSQQEVIYNMNFGSIPSDDYDESISISIAKQAITLREKHDKDLRAKGLVKIVMKELTISDASSVGRIVLPKKEAEAHLPRLDEREGIPLVMDDLELPTTWKFKYRYWPNNKSRMYVLEATGDFTKSHCLEPGDFLIIYKHNKTDNYVVAGEKEIKIPASMKALCNCNNQPGLNGRVPKNKDRGVKRRRSRKENVTSTEKAEGESFVSLLNSFQQIQAGSSAPFAGSPPGE